MDYKKIHDSLIERAKNRIIEGYSEKHHIIPRCMGGGNEAENLIKLTPEEHFLIHQLLVKIYPNNNSLVYSAHMMGNTRENSKSYGWIRRKHILSISGENSQFFGKRGKDCINFGRIVSKETREKLSKCARGRKHSPETRLFLSEFQKGEKSHMFGTKQSKESNKKRSDSMRGIKKSAESIRLGSISRKKAINQFSKSGEFIRRWDGIIDASKSLGISRQNMSSCINGRRNYCGGFIWRSAAT